MAANLSHQSPKEVIMIRPAAFGFDEDTMASNAFQNLPKDSEKKVHEQALEEFDQVVHLLKANGVTVVVFNDQPLPAKPDAIFPNNWFSTHADGSVFIYPMMAASRRLEQRSDIIKYLEDVHKVTRLTDLKKYEDDGLFLEGTGSIVFDHLYRRAYACQSSRTHPNLLRMVCTALDFEPVIFQASDSSGKPIYHTNVMMWIGTMVAAVCIDAITDPNEKVMVSNELKSTGREILWLSHAEMMAFAGNCLELRTRQEQELVLAISHTAVKALSPLNLAALQRQLRLIEVHIPTIEAVGGGGVRCMLAGVHL